MARFRTIRRAFDRLGLRWVNPWVSAVSRLPQRTWISLAIAGACISTGCTSEIHRYIRFPDFMHPGPAPYQRAAAIEHDPFPQNDVGPEIVGGRPLGFQAGVTEVERMTMNAVPPPGVAPTVLPGAPVGPPVGATNAPLPVLSPAPPAAQVSTPPPVITTPYPPAGAAQSPPFTPQRRSPY
jgi:hypothetical protein